MPQAKTNKLYRTFLKGLVTEASPLTYPPDATSDEDNMLISVAGNRARRLGIDYEDAYELSSHLLTTAHAETSPITEYVWRNVGNVEGLDFLCHQVRDMIYFYDVSGTPTSANIKAFTIDLNDYYISGNSNPELAPVQMISGKGYLFIVASSIDPLIVEYTELTDTITTSAIAIWIRDFDGVEDNLGVDEEPTTLSAEHNYNLQNQGWATDVAVSVAAPTLWGLLGQYIATLATSANYNTIKKYKDKIGKYPGNNKQWFLGKVEAEGDGYKMGDFNPLLLNKVHAGNSRAPKGHFLFNAFNKDRAAASGISGLAPEIKYTRPHTLCFAAGRVFYGHENSVYFSQVLSGKHKAGLCFQDNDPTAEDNSDLLDNDGGVIPIPSIDKIVVIKDVSNGIMVFANNGVWFISGAEKGFSATDYQVTKVSSIGTDAPYSIVDTQNHIYWWSKTGIQRIEQSSGVFGPISGSFKSLNLTENTIDRLFKEIPTTSRKTVKGVFDHGTNTIYWLYATADVGNSYFYNRLLNFNIITEAFFPWSVASGNYPHLCGHYITSDINRITNDENVVDDADEVVVTDTGEVVVASGTALSAKDTFIQYLIAVPRTGGWKFTVGNFTNDNFVDWETFDTDGIAYNSFIETGFELLQDDAGRTKQIEYLYAFFRQTEENFVLNGSDYTVDNPSSCYLTTKWDFSNSTASNKWATRTQAYRLSRVPFVNTLDLTLDTGFRVVTTRNRVRGSGKALQFRFECNEAGKNFDLLGWQVFYTGNTEPS